MNKMLLFVTFTGLLAVIGAVDAKSVVGVPDGGFLSAQSTDTQKSNECTEDLNNARDNLMGIIQSLFKSQFAKAKSFDDSITAGLADIQEQEYTSKVQNDKTVDRITMATVPSKKYSCFVTAMTDVQEIYVDLLNKTNKCKEEVEESVKVAAENLSEIIREATRHLVRIDSVDKDCHSEDLDEKVTCMRQIYDEELTSLQQLKRKSEMVIDEMTSFNDNTLASARTCYRTSIADYIDKLGKIEQRSIKCAKNTNAEAIELLARN